MKRLGIAILLLMLLSFAVCTMADDGFVNEMMVVKTKADIRVINERLSDYYPEIIKPDYPAGTSEQTEQKEALLESKNPFSKKPKDVEPTSKEVVFPSKDVLLPKKDTPDISEFIVKGIKGHETIELTSKIPESDTNMVYPEKLSFQAVPEPSSLLALIGGAGTFALLLKRRG